MQRAKTSIAALVLVLWATTAGAASLLNGGFETGGFSGWSTLGDTIVVSSSFGTDPFEGSFQALMSNGPSVGGNILNPDNVSTFSGTDSVSGPSLEGFFGLPFHALDDFSQSFVYEGSGIKQSFTTNTEAGLTFHWNFLTDEGINPSNPPLTDFGFFVLDGHIGLLTQGLSPSNTLFLEETGYKGTSLILSPGSGESFSFARPNTVSISSTVILDY